jgi:lipid A 3-O-deacylase
VQSRPTVGARLRSRPAMAMATAAAVWLARATAQAEELTTPYGAFIEAGAADDARSLVAGVAWTWLQPEKWGEYGHFSGYLGTSVGEWACHRAPADSYTHCATQVGVTPVIRFAPSFFSRWFLELGIGADAVFPLYRSSARRFGTVYEFGDHLGIGRRFGEQGRDELELRGEHYSNGGFKNPNPGENWVQLRYMHWF